MKKSKSVTIILAVAVFTTMAFIFYNSSKTGRQSAEISRRCAVVIARVFVKDYAEKPKKEQSKIVMSIEKPLRKVAHFAEFFIFGAIAAAFFFEVKPTKNGYSAALYAILVCAIFALTDEYHQAFVTGRGASLADVLIDVTGSFIGVASSFCVRAAILKKIRKRERKTVDKNR